MSKFDCFVLFAEMRTGSNFLEANLNALSGVACHGEAFNPVFIGYPNREDLLGVTLPERQKDPARLLAAIRGQKGVLGGFRFFNDHDPRILDQVLPDPRCAKIILTRNPLDSYVSRLIASATGQWKLTNASHAKTEVVTFDTAEFMTHLENLQGFQMRLLRAMQVTGQTAFYLDYEDIRDLDVMNGLAAFLGVSGRLETLNRKLKKQNPGPLEEKVANIVEMEQALARLDRFNLGRTPSLEPRRGPGVPGFIAAATSPLLYMPVRGGPVAAVAEWLTALDDAPPLDGFTQKTLRQWQRRRSDHRSFTVIRHPLARAHAAFCNHILNAGVGSFTMIREALYRHHDVKLPEGQISDNWSDDAHHAAFTAFLRFLKANLAGQTELRIDASWASQSVVIQGMARFALPDHILREDELATALPALAQRSGVAAVPVPASQTDPHHTRLARIYDRELEALARDVYRGDYMAFGFGPWK